MTNHFSHARAKIRVLASSPFRWLSNRKQIGRLDGHRPRGVVGVQPGCEFF